jgi:hypothetical protein
MRKYTPSGWILSDDFVQFHALDFGWEVERWFHVDILQPPLLADLPHYKGISMSTFLF